MLAFVEKIERENTVTVDGYTSNKTVKGIIRDVARAIAKIDEGWARFLDESAKDLDLVSNTPFIEAKNSDGGYFFEIEEVGCATKYDEDTDEMEYKEGYNTYFCIRIVK